MKILIVEDLIDDRRLLKYNMERRGHEVLEAENGQVALELVKKEYPDLIVSDLLMPVLDGFGLLRTLKAQDDLHNIPFIVYSSIYTGKNEKELAEALGADGFLVKPLVPDAIWQGIEDILANLKEKKPSRTIIAEHQDFLEKYSAIVATKLELKVQELLATQKELSAKEKQYRCLFHSMEDAILVLNTRWEVLDANQPALRNQLGLELDEVVGRELCSLFTDGIKSEELHAKICQGDDVLLEETIDIQAHFEKKDKTVIICHVSLSRLVDEKEKIIGIIAAIRDVTTQVEAEKKLRLARQEWDKTFDSIDDIVTLQGVDMRINRINAAGLKMFQKDIEELAGLHCYELFRGINEPCPDCPAFDTLNDFVAYSCEIFHENLQKTFLVSATPIVDNSGEIKGIAHFAKDITERKDLEKQLRQTQKLEAIGTLAGGIAHDFNNILSAIFGFAQLLELQITPGSQENSDVKQILKASHRAKDLVRQILAFSRSGEHKFAPLLVQSIIKEVLKLLRASIPSNITIRQQIDEECPHILGDATQIHQIMMNLCTNAYQAMLDREGALGVQLTHEKLNGVDFPDWPECRSGSYLKLEVSDTGTGIERKNLEKIFEPYFTTKGIGKGTGLGLSVVHGIVKNHGGYISVYSEPGEGTVFRIYLPVVEQSTNLKHDLQTEQPVPHGHGRILVVDDEDWLVNVQKRSLELLGYGVNSFTSSVEALAAFRSNPESYDLVITDMTMPKLNGLELTKEILKIRKNMPIIMCSGFSNLINDKKLKETGIRSFLMKPTDSALLARTVREVLTVSPKEARPPHSAR